LEKWFYTEWFQRRALVKVDALPPARRFGRQSLGEPIDRRTRVTTRRESGSKSSTVKTERTIKPKRSKNRLMAASVSLTLGLYIFSKLFSDVSCVISFKTVHEEI
jgi:hypothetical protein